MPIGLHRDPVTGQVDGMQFLTCSAPLPLSIGLHVVPTACGSGKTMVIGELAAEKKDEGVLIIVPTKADANDLGAKIIKLKGVAMSDLMILHSDNGPAMGEYKADPWSLSKKPILIITSVRPQLDPLDLFLTYGSGLRKWVFIDELINFYPSPFQVPEGLYDTLTFMNQKKTHNGKPAIEEVEVSGVKWYRHIYQDKGAMEAAFSLAGGSTKNLLPGRNELDKVKRDVIFEHVISTGFTPIKQRVQDMAKRTNVCLFDGTADLIFPKSDSRLVPVSGPRYNSDIQFHIFPCRMKRRELEDCHESDVLRLAPEFISLVTGLSKTEKVLVICWKTVGPEKVAEGLDMADEIEKQEDTVLGFPDILRRALISAGGKEDNIQITYRGSGQDRGSNQYRDCSKVVFLGEWRLPKEPIRGQISDMFGLKMKFWDYKKALLVQTICRSRIRQHTGLPIDVYFSDDINYQMAWEVQEYFRLVSAPGKKIGGLLKPCRILKKADKGYLYDLTRLYSYDPKIRSAIESSSPCSTTIPKKDLFNLIPKDKKEVGRYKRFIKFLKAMGITLQII